jgi:hypothetical protein
VEGEKGQAEGIFGGVKVRKWEAGGVRRLRGLSRHEFF